MFDETVTVSEQPMVTILETGPRYDLAAILAAFPTAVSLASALPPASAATEQPNPDDARELSRKAVAYYQEHEPDLWAGRWQDYRDSLSGEKPFPSQSEADYSLCRRIGYWGRDHGVPSAELPLFVETVFSQSALADRDKWRQRKDYRTRTVAKACDGLISPLMQAATSSNCPQGQPDWSLKGDLIAARFFKDLLGERMKFIVSIGKWLRWETDDNQWHWCELGEEVDATKQLVRELLRLTYLRAAEHPDTGQKFINEVSGLQREPRIRAVIELAKSEPGISMKAAKLDAHPELLGVRNGVVDLRTGRLRPNKPAHYISKYVDIEYSESASCPLFISFLNEVFQRDADTIDSVHRLAGLTLTGRADEEVIVFCVGTGANGKSIFGNIMTSIMGAHAVTAPPSLLAARRTDDHGPRSDLAMLHGARLVSINELPGGMMLDETVTKQLAGREPISARFLHKEFFTFKPQFTPWVRTNHRPIIKGTDNGIWRRIAIVPFLRTFSPNEQDQNLEKKLCTEKEGVLAWLVEGAKLYLRSGLKHSRSMQAELNQYRDDSDLLGEFLADYTIPEPDAEVKQSSLFSEYQLWCERNQLRPTSKRTFTEQLKERGFGQRKSGSERYYIGLKLTSSPFTGG